MTRNFVYFLFFCSLFPFVACSGNRQEERNEEIAGQTAETVSVARQFPFPEIPTVLTAPEERKAYLLEHYWDVFDFADTVLVNNREVTEQGVVNFLALLADNTTGTQLAAQGMLNFCLALEQEEVARDVLMKTMDNYLYDPNSPCYNERLYALYLQCMLQGKTLDDARKSTLAFRLELVNRNRVGTEATDFTYWLPDNRRYTLRQTRVAGAYLLLLFYAPECPTCHEVLQEMVTDRVLAEAVSQGKATVLAIYTEGDETAWRRTLPDMPAAWTVGNDYQQVKTDALYDLKAMPSLYLLDNKQQVILKDASYHAVKEYLGKKLLS